MKRYLFVLAALLAVACEKTPEQGKEETKASIAVSPSTLTFSSDGSETSTLTVTSSGDWTASKSASWMTVTPSSGTGNATVTVQAGYNAAETRTGTITFQDRNRTVSAEVTVRQEGYTPPQESNVTPSPAAFDGNKRASTTYQLLIYSFADSDGDGVGDFKGIQNRLDYLDGLGVTALWLSPAHPTSSYHAYDVDDYSTVNPLYGTEDDFKNLIEAAHAKGIKIYMDYVLNHSGRNNAWFKEALADPASPYRNYYVLSDNPTADVQAGRIYNFAGATNPGMGDWHSVTSGNKGYKGRLHFKLDWTGATKTVTVTETTEAAQASNGSAKIWLWLGSAVGLYETSTNVFEITYDVDTDWGFLVRTSNTTWDGGTKWGGNGNAITFGTPYALNNTSASDIIFGGSTTYYFASFDTSMPDLNYGKYTECENSPAFQAIASTAEKWIGLGVDGFRLDAVVWVYQQQVKANQRFLNQWYMRVNDAYKAAGHTDNIFMVGEAWDGHGTEKQYYQGLPSCVEFEYFGALTTALGGNASNYVNTVNGYIKDHLAQRPDAITSIFMTNHDQNRAAESLGRNFAKEKQAAAMMLTTPGKPFIYQGEELGYYGKKDGGDEYVRTPILWDKAGKQCAKKGVNNKVDTGMLTSAISVEAQEADASSLLNVYKTFSRVRNTYPALAEGTMTEAPGNGGSLAAWYMTGSDGSKFLVLHNTGSAVKTLTLSGDVTHPVALLGSATLTGNTLKLGASSSLVFQQ